MRWASGRLARAHVVKALDDERRLLGDGALEIGVEPVVALGVELRPQGGALGGVGLGHGGGVLALERAKLRVLDARVPVVAHCLLFFCVGVTVVKHVVFWFGFRVSCFIGLFIAVKARRSSARIIAQLCLDGVPHGVALLEGWS